MMKVNDFFSMFVGLTPRPTSSEVEEGEAGATTATTVTAAPADSTSSSTVSAVSVLSRFPLGAEAPGTYAYVKRMTRSVTPEYAADK
jgi:hypothetical protein